MDYSMEQVSKLTSLPPHTLRFYEREGLLPNVNRSKGGIRKFTDEDLEWLGLVRCLKETGMSIKQIRTFVELSQQGAQTLKQRCDMLLLHRVEVEEKIRVLGKHLKKVDHKIAYFTEQYVKASTYESDRLES